MRRGLFVTGTDTGVGKTVASAALMHGVRHVSDPKGSNYPLGSDTCPTPWEANYPMGSDTCPTPWEASYPIVRYWKPIQTGIEQDDDTAEVRRLGGCAANEILGRGIRLERPLSPHLSARLSGLRISIDDAMRQAGADLDAGTWIVEGAGGALVPINESEMMIDLMVRLALPVVVVSRTALGTINHTLLTLEALRARALRVAGVLLSGAPNAENRNAIEQYGGVRVVGVMPRFEPLTPEAVRDWARADLDVPELS